MVWVLKILGVLVLVVAIAILGYAFFGDLRPERDQRSIPVTLPNEG